MPDRFDIDRLHWCWEGEYLRCWAGRILGGNLPDHFWGGILQELRWDFPPSSHVWRLGCQLATYLMERLEPLEPIDVGADALINGGFDGPPSCQPNGSATNVSRHFLYSNGHRTQVKLKVADKDIPQPYRLMKEEILRICKGRPIPLT